MTETTTPHVQRLVAQVLSLPASDVCPDATQASLPAWDSLHHIHLIVALEGEFAVSIDPDDAIQLTSIPAIVACLGRLGVK
jgi:acyl carrier protein